MLSATIFYACASHRYAANSGYPDYSGEYTPHGELRSVSCGSSGDDVTQRRILVYLPSEYSDSTMRFPVLYMLHGARGNELAWIENSPLLQNIDSLIECAAMQPTILVLPNTNSYRNDRDFGYSRCKGAMQSFFGVDGSVERFFVDDVVNRVDSLFRTVPDKEHRAIAGLSLGAMQSIHISATHPTMFGYVGLFSPMVWSPKKIGADNRFFFGLRRKQAEQFAASPNLYWIMIGRRDFYCTRMRLYHRRLQRSGYRHNFMVTDGGHQWDNWEDYSIHFMENLWQ